MSKLRELSHQERFHLDTMANLKQFMDNFDPARDKIQLEGWKQRIEIVYKEFQINRLSLELLFDETNEEKSADEKREREKANRLVRQKFEQNYIVGYSFLTSKIQELNPPPQLSTQALAPVIMNTQQPLQSRIKLPEVKLPTFDGSISEWITFRDTYKSLIDSNTQLSQIDKFSYLVASLTKDARKVIESVELTEANYDVAWQLLEKRFDNKKLVVKNYIDSLFSIEPMKKECYESLMRLIDDFERNLCLINKMGIQTDNWSVLLAHMVCSRLDPYTLRQWEAHHKSTNVPEYKDLIDFLRTHLMVLQSLVPSKSRSSDSPKAEPYRPSKSSKINTVHTITNSTPGSCPFCSKNPHSPFKCDVFLKMAVSQRFELVKKKNLCINCLSSSHLLKGCSSSGCRVCNQKHHTMLHIPPSDRSSSQQKPNTSSVAGLSSQSVNQPISSNQSSSPSRSISSPEAQSPSTSAPASSLVSATLVGSTRKVPATVLLQTAIIKVFGPDGTTQWARALLDPASQLSLITENMVQKLKLRRYPSRQEIGGVGNTLVVAYHAVDVRMGSHCSEFTVEEPCHILKRITRELPANVVDSSQWKIPPGITLADPKFHEPGSIDLLLGMELYYDLLLDGFLKLGPQKPVLQNTVFGWVAAGKVGILEHENQPKVAHVCSMEPAEDPISRLWEIESCWTPSTRSPEETFCEDHFVANTFRDESGRFVVKLPKRTDVLSQLGRSKDIATRRFFALERRLDSNPKLKQAYAAFMSEYLQLNHMREIDDTGDSSPSYYLPHHGVEKADSTTTKLRVVFDASCRTDSGVSLNQALMVGPVVQNDLYAISLRFRMRQYAIVADAEKMYRQVRLNPSDFPFHRILWRESSTEPLKTYELTTVTYGTASAPFLATRCLLELSKQGANEFPRAAEVLADDFYIDDMLTSVDDEDEGAELCIQLRTLLQSAGFSLRKWASIPEAILLNIPPELRDERSLLALDTPSTIKTLGLIWEPSTDLLHYSVPKWSQTDSITRRTVLSDTAKLFDPLGLVGPVILLAKMFVQSLWRPSKSWDDPLDDEQRKYWLAFRSSLDALPSITVPRWVAFANAPVNVELHGFCDASIRAYGACIYIRTVSSDGSISVRLLTAKSKVAPLGDSKRQKKVSLPRLELSAALLLSHLYSKVNSSIALKTRPFFWSDSTITLHWINSVPSRGKTFVANRVSEVQHLTANGVWAHVSGMDNPADIISRGMEPSQLQDSIWWTGPPWLQQPSRFWPPLIRTDPPELPAEALEERTVSLPVRVQEPNEIFRLRSSFISLVRLTALIQRFAHNTKPENRSNRTAGPLQTSELNRAVSTLVRLAQSEVFPNEIAAVAADGQVKPNSPLKNLHPVLKDGILRVGGRLKNAPIPEDRKHPMILPARHPLTESIMLYYHHKHLHAGPQLLVACVREKFWPLRIRNLARIVVHSCISCFRCKPSVLEQPMGDLPPERVTPTLAFLSTGVDLCGPFQYRKLRKALPTKCYIAIFVCLATKAIHVEMVYDLSTAAFIAALHRFVARRGKPNIIHCDNARNFRGAARKLAELSNLFRSQQHQAAVVNHCSNDGIRFKFIPPCSPNFGGLWEAAVKSFKQHFRSTVGNSVLSQDEFVTLLTRIEACLNSRPLTPISADPNDLEVLTPGHFLIHRPLTSFPEPDLSDVPRNRLDRWQENQELLRRVWQRWSTDYLSGLHPRTKWTQLRNNIDVGTMVLLKEDNLPPLKWRYGRVIQVIRGTDGQIRVVDVKTSDGEYRRAISKICVLPVRSSEPAAGALQDLDDH